MTVDETKTASGVVGPTPLINRGAVTFVWYGLRPPRLLCDLNDWDPGHAFDLVPDGPGRWTHTLTLPDDAYLEYCFLLDGERVCDPLNPRTTPNGMGELNHFFYMHGAGPTPLARRSRAVPHGAVTRHTIVDPYFLVGGKRAVYLYQPPCPDPCPLLVVLDGRDYLRRARLPNIVDALVAQQRIGPIALALVHNAGPARGIEYTCSDANVKVLVDQVVPLARRELNLLDLDVAPGAYAIMGASMGGLAALYAGLRVPQVFGRILSQSGAFTLGGHDTVVWELVRHGPVQPLKIWMDVGRYEWLLPANQGMHRLLTDRGYDVAYREYNAGHNYPAWRDDLWRGLEHLFGAGGPATG